MLRTTAAAVLLSLPSAPVLAQEGQPVFDQQCRVCHGDERVAPRLDGVAGRKIASTDFDYSEALLSRQGNWDDATLDAFLKDPQAFAPGGKMVISVPDEATRRAVVAYLKTRK